MKNILQPKSEGLKLTGKITIRSYKAGTKELLQTIVQKNLIMVSTNRGLALLVNRLIADTTYTTIINYGAIGTSSTAVTTADTQLGTETLRTTVAFGQNVSNTQAKVQFFFTDTLLANGTYREFGTFVDGTASANSGRLFNHALFSTPYVKAGGTDTTVEVDFTFS